MAAFSWEQAVDTIPDDLLGRWLFLRGLALVALIAFVSLWSQILPLVGSDGILPVATYLDRARDAYGAQAPCQLPTLCWLNSSDGMLTALCAAGVFLSLCLLVGVAERLVLLGLWVIYLSLCVAGQTFLSFQWDTLLLETLLCGVLYAPRGWIRPPRDQRPALLAKWLLWMLCFKLMFLSGATKLLSGDETWRHLTAMDYHYFTQPIPNPLSWHAHHAPAWFRQLSLWLMYFAELIAPVLVFCGKWGRRAFALATIGLMAAIQATGNYGFFNLMTMVLALTLLDDRALRFCLRWVPGVAPEDDSLDPYLPSRTWSWRGLIENLMAALLMGVSLLSLVEEMVRSERVEKMPVPVVRTLAVLDHALLSWGEPWVLRPLSPLRSINGYGLFRVMTTERPEIVIEVSDDAIQWREFEFRFKPGDVQRQPPLVAPHMPRLDWQMWFAALSPQRHEHWLAPLVQLILGGSPEIARITGHPELVDHPPRYARLVYYKYEFTTPKQRSDGEGWWRRNRIGPITGTIVAEQAP